MTKQDLNHLKRLMVKSEKFKIKLATLREEIRDHIGELDDIQSTLDNANEELEDACDHLSNAVEEISAYV